MNWMLIWKILGFGWMFLIWAIVVNFIFMKIGFFSWYDFLKDMSLEISFWNYVILFLVYPFLLGLGVFLILKIINLQ